MKKIVILLLPILLVSCSMLQDITTGALKGAVGSDSGIQAEAQVGDRENDVTLGEKQGTGDVQAKDNAKVNVSNTKNNSSIDQADQVNIKNENIPFWVVLLLIIGWLLPDPRSILNYFTKGNK